MQHQLPNGRAVSAVNDYETDFVYHEIYVDKCYFQHDIKINDNAIVFDVGANIGLFSLFILENYPSSQLFVFEPIPHVFNLLKENTNNQEAAIHYFNMAVSDHNEYRNFYFYPEFTVISGLHANRNRDAEIICSGLSECETHKIALIKQRLANLQEINCQFTTLSAIIKQHQLTNIDLIKIDVEGLELNVLQGIEIQDFKIIKQIVIEVHHHDLLIPIVKLLKRHYFHLTIEEDRQLKVAGIYIVYAIQQINEI